MPRDHVFGTEPDDDFEDAEEWEPLEDYEPLTVIRSPVFVNADTVKPIVDNIRLLAEFIRDVACLDIYRNSKHKDDAHLVEAAVQMQRLPFKLLKQIEKLEEVLDGKAG